METLVIDKSMFDFLTTLGFIVTTLLVAIFVAILVLIFATAWRN